MSSVAAPTDSWRQHVLHGEGGDPWPVSNCYADLWIELLPWLGFDPVAAMSHCFAVNYEGSNWSFHKPPLRDLYLLYGLDVGEFNVWLDLAEHVEDQLFRGNPVLVEADAYFLPDTAATTYRSRHQKTTIAIVAIDRDARWMRFFHDSGLHELDGSDYHGVIGGEGRLPPYMEVVRTGCARPGDVWETASELARLHLGRAPESNPLERYEDDLRRELAALAAGEFDFYDWAFSTVRQAGSAYQYSAAFCRASPAPGMADAAAGFERASNSMKALMIQVARAIRRSGPPDSFPALEAAAAHWQEAIDRVRAAL